jgi:hypothetical protein
LPRAKTALAHKLVRGSNAPLQKFRRIRSHISRSIVRQSRSPEPVNCSRVPNRATRKTYIRSAFDAGIRTGNRMHSQSAESRDCMDQKHATIASYAIASSGLDHGPGMS